MKLTTEELHDIQARTASDAENRGYNRGLNDNERHRKEQAQEFEGQRAHIIRLQTENSKLRAQVDALTAQLAASKPADVELADWAQDQEDLELGRLVRQMGVGELTTRSAEFDHNRNCWTDKLEWCALLDAGVSDWLSSPEEALRAAGIGQETAQDSKRKEQDNGI